MSGVSWLGAAVPLLEHFYPVTARLGATNAINAIGKFDPWPTQIWTDSPGIVFRAGTNSGLFLVEVAPDVAPGPHLVRAFNPQGASGPRFLMVEAQASVLEKEPNDDAMSAQRIESLPVLIDGRLDRGGDVDSYAVILTQGQTLIASLEAYVLASPVDAVLRLIDSRGVQVALNHDDGRTLDPFLTWTATTNGTYGVQVFGFSYPAGSDVRFAGGNTLIYRLHLSGGPWLQGTSPLGVQRGETTPLELAGWNLGAATPHSFQFDGKRVATNATQALLCVPGFENQSLLPVGEGVETLESEPNDVGSAAGLLVVPGAVSGCIGNTGDEDRFFFQAKKGEILRLELQSAVFGFPLDAWLAIEDGGGKQLARSDDGPSADPSLEWTAPSEGRYIAAVGSLLHRGGAEYRYRLAIRFARPEVKAFIKVNTLALKPGETNEFALSVSRRFGGNGNLQAAMGGLPAGIGCDRVTVPETGGEVKLKLIAAKDAKPFNGVVHPYLIETTSGREYRAVFEFITSGIDNGVPNGFNHLVIESTEEIWLTVIP